MATYTSICCTVHPVDQPSAMVNLFSLPMRCSYASMNTAPRLNSLCLSSVNRRLRSLWLNHTNHVAEAILRRQIPAYQDAVELVVLEETLIYKTRLALPTTNQVPVRLYLSQVLRNASLASSATAAWAACEGGPEPDRYQAKSVHNSPQAVYFLMRKIVF